MYLIRKRKQTMQNTVMHGGKEMRRTILMKDPTEQSLQTITNREVFKEWTSSTVVAEDILANWRNSKRCHSAVNYIYFERSRKKQGEKRPRAELYRGLDVYGSTR